MTGKKFIRTKESSNLKVKATIAQPKNRNSSSKEILYKKRKILTGKSDETEAKKASSFEYRAQSIKEKNDIPSNLNDYTESSGVKFWKILIYVIIFLLITGSLRFLKIIAH